MYTAFDKDTIKNELCRPKDREKPHKKQTNSGRHIYRPLATYLSPAIGRVSSLSRAARHPQAQGRICRIAIHRQRLVEITRMVCPVSHLQDRLPARTHRFFRILHRQATARSHHILNDPKLLACIREREATALCLTVGELAHRQGGGRDGNSGFYSFFFLLFTHRLSLDDFQVKVFHLRIQDRVADGEDFVVFV